MADTKVLNTRHRTIEINTYVVSDIPTIVQIHKEQFPKNRSSSLGGLFLGKMYRWFMENHPELALVAHVDNQITGYAVGAIGGYGRKIFRYAFPEILFGFFTHPWLFLRQESFTLWPSYLRAFLPAGRMTSYVSDAPLIHKASLASIAVSKSAQGFGIGKKLLLVFESNAQHLGAGLLSLTVDKENQPARKLYESAGWRLADSNLLSKSVRYNKNIQ